MHALHIARTCSRDLPPVLQLCFTQQSNKTVYQREQTRLSFWGARGAEGARASARLSRVRQGQRAGWLPGTRHWSVSKLHPCRSVDGRRRSCGASQAQPERRDGIAIHRHHPSQKKAAPDERPLLPARTALHRVDSGYSARSNLFLVSQVLFFDCLRIATSAGQIQ